MAATRTDPVLAMPGGIEGLERLKIPQSSFTLKRRARPPPIDIPVMTEQPRLPIKQASTLNRQQSKGGIRSIFNRHKAEKVVATPLLEEGGPQSAVLTGTTYDAALHRSASTQQTTPVIPTTPAKSVKRSRMNLRGRAVKEGKPSSKPSPKSNAKASPGRPTRTSTAWDPPPLFQAYPQAIKHAQLAASTLSADSILRISNHQRNSSITEYNPTSTIDGKEQAAAAKKTEKARIKHRRQISGSMSKADWTQKTFVLVTSGYLLQYAGEGSFDRLPEKMMQLGKDSVAFASDVIPGKHWVLQISQSIDADGTPTSDSRSLLSRLTFRGGADYRRTATSLLLVLDSAEDMDAWLAVVRREIEALGGKKYVPDIVRQKSDEKVLQLSKRPSHRYLVQKDPDQFSNPTSPTALIFEGNFRSRSNSMQRQTEPAYSMDWPHASARPSTSYQSGSNSVVSHDGRQLDELRNSNRFSYMSSGQRTVVSAQFSSPEASPTMDSSLTTFEDSTPKVSLEEVRPRPNASAINERRRSMQIVPIAALESQHVPKAHRHSTYGPPVTPNFSVPNSSSRRFSSNKNHNIIPNSSVSTRSLEPILKGARKAPPPAITVARPLSPVVDDPSPMQEVNVVTPAESSFDSLQQITASVIDIAPRSPLFIPSPVESSHIHQSQSQTPLKRNSFFLATTGSARPKQPDFQFPKRSSSMISTHGSATPTSNTFPASMSHQKRNSLVETPSPTKRHSLATPPQHHLRNFSTKPERPSDQQTLPPLPALANTKTKLLRRPTSMQIRPSSFAGSNPTTSPTTASLPLRNSKSLHQPTFTTGHPVASSTTPFPLTTPRRLRPPPKNLELKAPFTTQGVQRLKTEEKKALANRRSLPFLVGGPPPAPPPNCALPPLPPLAAVSASKRMSVK